MDRAELQAPALGLSAKRVDRPEADEALAQGRDTPLKWVTRENLPPPDLTDDENAIFDLMDEISAETCNFLPPGDIQFCNNYTCLHGRAAMRWSTRRSTSAC